MTNISWLPRRLAAKLELPLQETEDAFVALVFAPWKHGPIPDALPMIESKAREARVEATPQNQRLTQVTDRQQKIESEAREPQAEAPPQNHQQNQFDRFSLKDY
jgi:hypothetical protein